MSQIVKVLDIDNQSEAKLLEKHEKLNSEGGIAYTSYDDKETGAYEKTIYNYKKL